MDIDLPRGSRNGNTSRSSNGCWTCRLRRKKCDEAHPICSTCSSLRITCYFDENRPEWMDGGLRQEEMAQRLKLEVKEKARYRYEDPNDRNLVAEEVHGVGGSRKSPMALAAHTLHEVHNGRTESNLAVAGDPNGCTNTGNGAGNITAFQRSDSMLVMFYLEHVLPFLFPFYNPPFLQGGKAWVLDLMITSPVYRQACLCQSSYFFSLARSLPVGNVIFETVLKQTKDAFEGLSQALLVIDGPRFAEHLHGAVRILASIMQLQRFETTILSFNNCQSHLNAALALFGQLLDSSEDSQSPAARFQDVMSRLGPSPWKLPSRCMKVPSAEQAAFKFSTAQLILDDLIASTVLQEEPRLYHHHQSMLIPVNGGEPVINLQDTIGCQNWAIVEIANIAALDAWKKRCKGSGNLDIMELVSRATVIKNSLQTHLLALENEYPFSGEDDSSPCPFTPDYGQRIKVSFCQMSLITLVWAHAALLYLFTVVSGWQPANADVRFHVGRIIELLRDQLSMPVLIRAMPWPFCVAGCLAEPIHEATLRGMVDPLNPSSVFGTVRKALEIMENVWKAREENITRGLDLAACFRSQGELVLLV